MSRDYSDYSVNRGVVFEIVFGVFPATGLMIGGVAIAFRGGPDMSWWAILAVILGVAGAFGWIWFTSRMVTNCWRDESAERFEQWLRDQGPLQ